MSHATTKFAPSFSNQSSMPIAVRPAQAAALTGIGKTTLYAAIARGELTAVKRGRSTLLMVEDLRKWLSNSPKLRPANRAS